MKAMNIKEMVDKKAKTEKEIQIHLEKIIEQFQDDIGIGVNAIYIKMIDCTQIGDKYKRFFISDVDISIKI